MSQSLSAAAPVNEYWCRSGSLCSCLRQSTAPSLAALPNYRVNLTRNGAAVAGFHFILARAIHTAAGRLHS